MRETLRAEMKQLIGTNSLARIKAVVGDATVDVIGEPPSAVTLGNNFIFDSARHPYCRWCGRVRLPN